MEKVRRKNNCLIGLTVGLVLGICSTAFSFDGGVGTAIGDQGSDFRTGQEVFMFPQGLFNIDERVVLQYVSGDFLGRALDVSTLMGGNPNHQSTLYNSAAEELANGGGFVVAVDPNLQVGMWVGLYAPTYGAFLARGMNETGWTDFVGVNNNEELEGMDPYEAGLEPARKLDLFAAYRLDDLDVGLRLWWGSTSTSYFPDDQYGPVNIDSFSGGQAVDGETELPGDEVEIAEGTFSLKDFGIGLGAGYSGLDGARIDFGLQFGMPSSTYEPNGISDFYELAGHLFKIKVRGMYEISSNLEVGASLGFNSQGTTFKPLKQRDGGDLVDFDPEPLEADGNPVFLDSPGASGSSNTMPSPAQCLGGDQQYSNHHGPQGLQGSEFAGNELCPVYGAQYDEGMSQFDFSVLAQYEPVPQVTLYSAVGLGYVAAKKKASVVNNKGNEEWYIEDTISSLATPFIRVGFQGEVTKWFDVMMGVSRRWQQFSVAREGYDSRITDDDIGPGENGTTPVGNENNVNANRQTYNESSSYDASITQASLGFRAHYSGLQLVAHLDANALFNGVYFISGKAADSSPLTWINIIYDWDYDRDGNEGNGTFTSPHAPRSAVDDVPLPARRSASSRSVESVKSIDSDLDDIVDAAVAEDDEEDSQSPFPSRP